MTLHKNDKILYKAFHLNFIQTCILMIITIIIIIFKLLFCIEISFSRFNLYIIYTYTGYIILPKINICQTHVSVLVAIYTSKGGLLSLYFKANIKENTIMDSTFTKSVLIIMVKNPG